MTGLTGVAIGASAWVSLGVVALVDPARMTRVGALPALPWLAALMLCGGSVGAFVGPRLWQAPLALLVLPWLPWLPFTAPSAFLLWDGPLEGGVWAAALLAAAWPLGRTMPQEGLAEWVRSPRRAPWLAAVVFAAVALAAWGVARPRVPAGDEPHYLVITQSLLRDGDLRIENNHRAEHYLEYYDAVLKPDFMRRGTDREIYSIHAPGVSAVVLPAFAVAGYPGAVVTVVAVGALGMAALWTLVFRLTASAGAAWMGWAAVATSAPVLLHAFTIYPDPVGGALAIVALGALVALETGAVGVSGRQWVGTGAALALLPWLHTRFAIIAGGLGIAIVLRLWRDASRRSDVWRFLSVPVASALAWFCYFIVIYGTPNPAAPYGTRPEGGLSFIPAGVTGLLLDQQFGLFTTAPVLVAGIAGLVVLARERRRLALEILAVVMPYVAVAASYPMWWGGYSAPARFLVALVPLLALPAGTLWARGSATTRAVVGMLLALSAGLTTALVGIDRGAFILSGREGHAPLIDWLSRSADLTLALPSVHRDGLGRALEDAALWLVSGVAVVAAARLVARRQPRAAAVAGVLAAPAVVMLAATLAWTGRDRAATTPNSSQMSWLARWTAAQAPTLLQLAPTRALTVDDAPRRLNIGTSLRGRRGAVEPLLRLPDVPAGDYDVFIEPRGASAGTVTVRLGRQDVPMEQWGLDGRPAGYSGLVLRLPVAAHSITMTGDAAAVQSVARLTLRPRTLAPRGSTARALRAARYGGVVVFALDDMAFMEPGALWVRGGQTAAFGVRADEGRAVTLRLTAGPVPNEVRLTAGPWTRTLALAAGQVVDVAPPAEALAPGTLAIASRTGFRPSEHGPSGDGRRLGVFVTWPDGAAPAGAAGPGSR
ncbi:MAG: hypothetical protein JNL48_17690 [Acidobacteria bacterium]|nr:hypothetical protein [Acidobacteriota bacterium]